jgi:cell division protein FtsW (lipid II flippase)
MTLLVAGLALLGLTLIAGVNPSGAGAALWLRVPIPFAGDVYFQPSELLKPLFAIFFASYFAERVPFLPGGSVPAEKAPVGWRSLPFLGPLLLMGGFSLLLLVWQRDLGAAALFFLLFLALLYLATGRLVYVLTGLSMLVAGGVFGYLVFGDLVALRVDAWLNPWPDANDRAYQIVQSLYAFASGGVTGQGIGQGYPEYIPVVHSDFAFAAVGEEWGLVGTFSLLACFALLAQRALRAAVLSTNRLRPRPFHTYLAAGIAVLFSVQALLIMGGVTKLLPLTGITLPFVSYGGSSLVVSGLMVGLLIFVTNDANTPA